MHDVMNHHVSRTLLQEAGVYSLVIATNRNEPAFCRGRGGIVTESHGEQAAGSQEARHFTKKARDFLLGLHMGQRIAHTKYYIWRGTQVVAGIQKIAFNDLNWEAGAAIPKFPQQLGRIINGRDSTAFPRQGYGMHAKSSAQIQCDHLGTCLDAQCFEVRFSQLNSVIEAADHP